MNELGEIRKGTEVGYKGNYRYIWAACEECGKERWVRLFHGKAISPMCRSCSKRIGPKSDKWKKGRRIQDGYVNIFATCVDGFFRSMANKNGYIREHRLVVAKHLNRCLLPWEVVHHINGIKDDNRLENLKLLPNVGSHNTMIEKHLKKQERMIKQLSKQLQELKNEIRLLRWENKQLKGASDSADMVYNKAIDAARGVI